MRNAYSMLAIQHAAHRPLRTLLTLVGVAVGVSAAMAIHIANVEVLRVFEASVTTVTGESTIAITPKNRRIDEGIIADIRRHPAVHRISPVLRETVFMRKGSHPGASFVLWGVDLVSLMSRYPDLRMDKEGERKGSLDALLDPQAVFVGKRLAQRLELTKGDQLTLSIGKHVSTVFVRGVMESGQGEWLRGDSLAIMDIASAQVLLRAVGQLDAIYVLTAAEADIDQVIDDLRGQLPPSVQVDRPPQRNRQVERMIRTFQMNLTTMSLVGLLVGIFLMYNTIAFSVVQHRREIGVLRAIGMSRAQVSAIFLVEAAIIGVIGGMMGTGIGGMLAEFLTSLVTESLSELYTAVTVRSIRLPMPLYVAGGGLGMIVAMIGAAAPCWEAGRTPPARVLASGGFEQEYQLRFHRFALLVFLLFGGAILLALPGPVWGMPVFGYASALCLLLGCACLGPLSVKMLDRMSQWHGMRRLGLVSRLAIDQVVRAPGRTSVTLSALMVGIAIMVGVGIMVQSFRQTVELWIDQTLMADLIVAPRSWLHASQPDGSQARVLDPSIISQVAGIPGVAAVDPYLQDRVMIMDREFELVARNFAIHAERSRYLFVSGESKDILHQARLGEGIIISEVLAGTLGIQTGDHMPLSTPMGTRNFVVAGVFYDYATDGGKVVMDQSVYEKWWGTLVPTVLAVYAEESIGPDDLQTRLEYQLAASEPVAIIHDHELRREILAIFDRTFRVTLVLEGIALVVAVLGIANTLVISVLERQRELATLRAIGAGREQVQRIILGESIWLGLLGSCLGLLGGIGLAVLLIEVINKQSFGWTIHFSMSWIMLLEAVLVGCGAAIAAGYFPARWATDRSISEGLRYE